MLFPSSSPSSFPFPGPSRSSSSINPITSPKEYAVNRLPQMAFISVAFWATTSTMQRILGRMSIHGGRNGYITALGGISSYALCSLMSYDISNRLTSHLNEYLSRSAVDQSPSNSWMSLLPISGQDRFQRYTPPTSKELIKHTLAGLATFSILEQRAFRTLLPSSVLTLGVFANTLYSNIHSVPTTTELTTESQRKAIQKIGRRIGCHHCGSRQLLSRDNFIADHMPPTKYAKQLNSAWWRRLFGIKVSQRLWAQCQSCFQKQGSAVRENIHRLAHHSVFRVHHFAPAIGLVMMDIPEIDHVLDEAAEGVLDICQRLKSFFQ